MQFESTILVSASAEKIFALYADVPNWPQWDPDVKAVSIDGPFVSGATGVVEPHGGPKSKLVFTNVVANKSFSAQCKLPLCTMRFDHTLQAEGSQTKVTHGVVFEGFLAPLFGRLIGSGMRKSLPKALQQLKLTAQGDAAPATSRSVA